MWQRCITSSQFITKSDIQIFFSRGRAVRNGQKNALLPRQSVLNSLHLAARVIRIKYRALMAVVIHEKVFGEVKAHIRGIKFQKGGLPHRHCLIFQTSESKTIYYNHLLSTLSFPQRFVALLFSYFVKSPSSTTCTIFAESSALQQYI